MRKQKNEIGWFVTIALRLKGVSRMIKQKFIWVTFQKEGIHKYPDAPEGVEFLKYPHRHIFHFRVELEVFHEDRDVEFILFKRELEKLFVDGTMQLDYKSCEMIADDLAFYITNKYSGRDLVITVSEDGENGATCYYPKD
jgi:hypothetical protein